MTWKSPFMSILSWEVMRSLFFSHSISNLVMGLVVSTMRKGNETTGAVECCLFLSMSSFRLSKSLLYWNKSSSFLAFSWNRYCHFAFSFWILIIFSLIGRLVLLFLKTCLPSL